MQSLSEPAAYVVITLLMGFIWVGWDGMLDRLTQRDSRRGERKVGAQ